MKWADALSLAARELRRRPARSVLTAAAVILAAALLVALLAVVTTARTRVLSQISKGGALSAITVQPAQPNLGQATLDDPTPGPYKAITQQAVDAMRRMPMVSAVDAVQAAPVLVLPPSKLPAGSNPCGGGSSGQLCYSPGGAYQSRVVGADLSSLSTLPITLLAGVPPIDGTAEVDVSEGYLQQIGLPQSRASELLGTDVELGEERQIGPFVTSSIEAMRWVTEEIVGVVDQQVGSGDIVAWPSVANAAWGWQSGTSGPLAAPYAAVVVVADQLGDVQAVRADITAVGYNSSAPEGLIVSIGRYIHVVEIVLSGIGFVALVIAALGIANALFASVRERRNEIGVMKAIGARDSDVLRIFLAEAAALGLVGGLVGTSVGIAIALAIGAEASNYLSAQGLAPVSLSIPWLLPFAGAAGSAAVALVAGLPAALRAADLPAREAVAR